tara:strand:- start:210 stop:656 length:447 start_codon:yes stop_codon:yes gene_type:complete
MKAKNKRLVTLTSLLIIFFVGCITIFNNLKNNLVFFFSPSEVTKKESITDQKIRVGGMVKKNSVVKEIVQEKEKKIQKISFVITDFKEEIFVFYKGILPDLFQEGQGVVVEGVLINNFEINAETVLAKHDENYMPPELDFLNTSKKEN